MTQQTHGTPELKYSEETFRELYEALKAIIIERALTKTDPLRVQAEKALVKVEE